MDSALVVIGLIVSAIYFGACIYFGLSALAHAIQLLGLAIERLADAHALADDDEDEDESEAWKRGRGHGNR